MRIPRKEGLEISLLQQGREEKWRRQISRKEGVLRMGNEARIMLGRRAVRRLH
jgi:hypothetical protein